MENNNKIKIKGLVLPEGAKWKASGDDFYFPESGNISNKPITFDIKESADLFYNWARFQEEIRHNEEQDIKLTRL